MKSDHKLKNQAKIPSIKALETAHSGLYPHDDKYLRV